MKYILITVTLLLMTVASHAQSDAISRYFDRYVDDEDFTVVYVSGKMFSMLSKIDVEELEDQESKVIMDVAKNINGLRVLVTEKDPQMHYKAARKLMNKNTDYEVLMTVREAETNVNFWIRENGDTIEELFLLVGSEEEFVMISFLGVLDLNKLAKLSNSIDMKGAEHLDKIKDTSTK